MTLTQRLRARLASFFSWAAQLASVTAEVNDKNNNAGWTSLSGGGPVDRPWSELQELYRDVVDAWRLNGWVRQVVRLTRAYVTGDGVTISSEDSDIQTFISEFWHHPENRMDSRLGDWCDELTRSGELYPVLFTNKISGISQVRPIPAACITSVETDPDDYEKEIGYKEQVAGQLEPKLWKSWRTARVFTPRKDQRHQRPEPAMLHFAVNKIVGATRGESDLTPLLPWAKRYTSWLKERALFNRIRNALAGLVIRVMDRTKVKDKQEQYKNISLEGGVLVVGPDEEVSAPDLSIRGFDAEPDGKALRLAMATASNQSLVHFGEGDSALRSTSASMDDRTYRFYRERRNEFGQMLIDLVFHAYRRFLQTQGVAEAELPRSARELGITAKFPDISRADNKELADAAKLIVTALGDLKMDFDLGPEFDRLAIAMSFKFAGEILSDETIDKLLAERGIVRDEYPDDEQEEQIENARHDSNPGYAAGLAAAGIDAAAKRNGRRWD